MWLLLENEESIRVSWLVSRQYRIRAKHNIRSQGAVVAMSNGVGPVIGGALASQSENSWYVEVPSSNISCFGSSGSVQLIFL